MTKSTTEKPPTYNLEQQAGLAELTFLFCNHSVSNYSRIIDAVESVRPDIIVAESAGETLQERADRVYAVNALLRGEKTDDNGALGWLDEDLVERFANRGITYDAIDVTTDTTAWSIHQDSINQLAKYDELRSAIDTPATIRERRHLASNFLAQSALAMAMREEAMASALTDLALQHVGKRITVIAGMMHTGVQHRIPRAIPSTRRFINSIGDDALLRPGEKVHFSAHEAARRAIILGAFADTAAILATAIDSRGRIIDYSA